MVPHSSIDTEAGWSKSGWHGWWYGWKLHLAVTVGALWIPLAAELTVANRGDNEEAPLLLEQLPGEVRYVLGDTHYNTPSCGRSATGGAGSWSPRAAGHTRTAMAAWKCAKSSTSCGRKPSNRLMGCSKTSLSGA